MTTENLQNQPAALEALRVSGRDGADFLHRLLTCAIKTLPPPPEDGRAIRWMAGCLLGGDGRVRQELLVIRDSAQSYLLVPMGPGRLLDDGRRERLFDALDAYLFAEQVALSPHAVRIRYGSAVMGRGGGAHGAGHSPALPLPATGSIPADEMPPQGGVWGLADFLEGRGSLFCRMDWVEHGDGVVVEPVLNDDDLGLVEAVEDFPVAGGGILDGGLGLAAYADMLASVSDPGALPRADIDSPFGANFSGAPVAVDLASFPASVPMLGRDYTHQAIALEAGLKGCISFTKGCFPGQEIMARIENLGHPARLIVGITAESGDQELGGRILYGQRPDGTWTEVGSVGGGLAASIRGQRMSHRDAETQRDPWDEARDTPKPIPGHPGPDHGTAKACAMVRWDWRVANTVLALGESAGPKVLVLGPVEKYPPQDAGEKG